ncbi:NmrA family NAD(P)-binding protein [Microbispora sp. H13382]|uniref:NmrA family NAD(P)-binding protein n=1 Tax=Microbispora sp. H13382 TaxID=2729112 RepID=UPI00160215C2|nr:NmrA family NAD(P)-binding protein [Microbispora sp. H13382]
MILVTGISGGLGGLIFRGLSAEDGLDVAGGTRSGDGATARRIDFDDPTSLTEGFRGVDVLVFVSAGYAEDDVVLARHGAVVDAAGAAGVRHVVYTSLARSGDLLTIALPHRWTEARLAAAPFDVTILRNGLYAEVAAGLATAAAASAAETGVFAAAFGAGRVSIVAKEDLAEVAVRVATETQRDLASGRRSRHAGKTYELEGVEAVGGQDIAEVLSDTLNRPVCYQPISLSTAREALAGSGQDPYQITHTLSIFSNIRAGCLEAHDTDLTTLLPAGPRDVRDQLVQAVGESAHQSVPSRT